MPTLTRYTTSHNTPKIRPYRDTFSHTKAYGPFITQGKRTCVAGQKQIVQLVVVVVVGRHGGGGGVQLDLLEHLRRQRIRVILRIINKKRNRYTHRRLSHHNDVHVGRNTSAAVQTCSARTALVRNRWWWWWWWWGGGI